MSKFFFNLRSCYTKAFFLILAITSKRCFMKKISLLVVIFTSGIFFSLIGCGKTAPYYKLTDINFEFASPGNFNQINYIQGDTLIIIPEFIPEYITLNRNIKGFENNSYAFQYFVGEKGFKDALTDFHLSSNTNINGNPAGTWLDNVVTYQTDHGDFVSHDSIVSYLNEGALANYNQMPFYIYLSGSHVDTIMNFTLDFQFENSTFQKTTDNVTWVP